jgi:hypothetical protein
MDIGVAIATSTSANTMTFSQTDRYVKNVLSKFHLRVLIQLLKNPPIQLVWEITHPNNFRFIPFKYLANSVPMSDFFSGMIFRCY